MINLLRKDTGARSYRLLTILILIEDLLVHQDDYLQVAEILFLLFAISNAFRINTVTNVAKLCMNVVARKEVEFDPLV